MSKGGKQGLILDRSQLCEALQISDSTIGAWEVKGLPAVRKGRGRGMKSLYNLDEVRSWCETTGYGHSTAALLARFMRTEPPPPEGQLTAEPAWPAPEDKVSPWQCALEDVLIAVFPVLVHLDRDRGARLFAALMHIAVEELRARGAPEQSIADFRELLPGMAEEELHNPGAWLELEIVQMLGLVPPGPKDGGNGPTA